MFLVPSCVFARSQVRKSCMLRQFVALCLRAQQCASVGVLLSRPFASQVARAHAPCRFCFVRAFSCRCVRCFIVAWLVAHTCWSWPIVLYGCAIRYGGPLLSAFVSGIVMCASSVCLGRFAELFRRDLLAMSCFAHCVNMCCWCRMRCCPSGVGGKFAAELC